MHRHQLPKNVHPLACVTIVGALADTPHVHRATASKRAIVDAIVQVGEVDLPVQATGAIAERLGTLLPGTLLRMICDLTVYNWQTDDDKHRHLARISLVDCEVLSLPVGREVAGCEHPV